MRSRHLIGDSLCTDGFRSGWMAAMAALGPEETLVQRLLRLAKGLNPISRDMTTTLRDNRLAATALDDFGRLWAVGRNRGLRSVRRRIASSGRFALNCGVYFRAE